ncbi:hypothetical protein LTR86_010654 [Recurvomyces mirabilis]|nr:hypothetical protein LTR86_010654 [Recurvomyces mirabilis]
MASALEQVIVRLQDLQDQNCRAHELVQSLEMSVAEHEAQLAEARTKLGDARHELEAQKQMATTLTGRFSDILQHPIAAPVSLTVIPPEAATNSHAARLSNAVDDTRKDGHTEMETEQAATAASQGAQLIEPYEVIHGRFENVVLLDGGWTEIGCHLCGANACGNGRLFKGLSGLHNHITGKHSKGKTLHTRQDTLEKCTKRIINAQDVAKMQAGEDPVQKIIVTPASMRPDASQAAPDHHISTSSKVFSRSKPQAAISPPTYFPLPTGHKRRKMDFIDCDDSEPDINTIKKEF